MKIDIDEDICKARTIPSKFYHSPKIYRKLKKLFNRSWQFVGDTDLLEKNRPLYKDHNRMVEILKSERIIDEIENGLAVPLNKAVISSPLQLRAIAIRLKAFHSTV